MTDIFKTILILSLLGSGLTALLLVFKPITAKKFPAAWQYYVWVAVLFFMVIPAYKLIPQKEVQKIPRLPMLTAVEETAMQKEIMPEMQMDETPSYDKAAHATHEGSVHVLTVASHIWLFGICIYLVTITTSYAVYIMRKRKKALEFAEHAVLNAVKRELKIKRHIKIRLSADGESPMLAGVFFPTVYVPQKEMDEESMRMVLLHELTHYRRKDLAIKWIALFVNAVHWFNPAAYLLCANISEACEVSCDMEVTKNMSGEEQKVYMKTILDLAG